MMKTTVRTLSFLLCVFMCLTALAGCKDKNKEDENSDNSAFDYISSDLSAYISIPSSLYENLKISLNLDAVTDADVEDTVGNILALHRGDTFVGKNTGVVGYGDVVKIWYRGYTVDENGVETDLAGACNLGNTAPTELTVGGGGYVSGFESALVGASYSLGNKPGLAKRAAGESIQEGDTVYVLWSGTKQEADKSYKGYSNQLVRFVYHEESRAAVESQYGLPAEYKEGLISFFDLVGTVNVGEYYDGDAMFNVETDSEEKLTVWYYSLQVLAATQNECEDNKLAVADAYFPINYGDETFNGKNVKFDFYIDADYNYFKDYEVPAFDAAFIHDTLGVSDADLAEYEGEDTVSRYKSKLRAQLTEKGLEDAKYNSLWKLWNDGVTVLKYPDGEVESFVSEYREDFDSAFASAAQSAECSVEDFEKYYYSKEEFAHAYYESMDDEDTLDAYIQKQATDAAKEKLILYALAKLTGNLPTDAEQDAAYDDIVDGYVEYYVNNTSEENEYRRENFDTEEAFSEAKAELREKVISYYGTSFLRESAFYQCVMSALSENIVEYTYLGRH